MLKQFTLSTLVIGICSVTLASPLNGLTVKMGGSILNPTGESNLVGGVVQDARAANEINFTPSLDYRFGKTPFSMEVLLATPFNQSVVAKGLGEIATLKHLPPTVTAKYNLTISDRFTAYAGVGATVLIPWDEELSSGAKAALGLTSANKLEADVSVGAAAQLGFNFQPADAKNWGVYGDVRYADLKTDLVVKGVGDIGTLDIHPLVFTLGYSYNF